MRKAILMFSVLISMTLSACVSDADDPVDESEIESNSDIREKWCNSYPQSHCPTNVCVWQSDPAPGKCTLPSFQAQ